MALLPAEPHQLSDVARPLSVRLDRDTMEASWLLKIDIVSDIIRPWDDPVIETAGAVVVLVRVPINPAPVVLPAECHKRFN
jgi:hypothetical protein